MTSETAASALLLREALAIEETDPRGAITVYDSLEKRNRHFYADAALAALCLPILGAVLSWYLGRIFVAYRQPIAGILLFAAYMPALSLFEKYELRKGFRYPGGKFSAELEKSFMRAIYFAAVLAEPLIVATYIIALAFVLFIPVAIVNAIAGAFGIIIPPAVLDPLMVVSCILAVAWVFSALRPPPPPLRTLFQDLAVAVWRNRREILMLFAQAAAGVVLISAWVIDVLAVSLADVFFGTACSGFMLALCCYSGVGKDPTAGTLLRLGRARCSLRLGRKASARADLREIEESPPFAVTERHESLADALRAIEGSRRERGRDSHYDVYDAIRRAADSRAKPDADLWQETIRRTWSMSGVEPVEGTAGDLRAMLRNPAVPPWKRVVAGQELARIGDPRFSEKLWYLPDEPLLGFVEIPERPFTMGFGENAHEVFLMTYYIARHPVTRAQVASFIHKREFPLRNWERTGAHRATEAVRAVRWGEALTYCEWLEKELKQLAASRLAQTAMSSHERQFFEAIRDGDLTLTLPSEAEWEKAARGTDARLYPWGNDLDPNAFNCSEHGIDSPAPAGCFPAGASPYGVEEMLGAGEQWTRSLYTDYPYRPSLARESLNVRGDAVLRGSSPAMMAGARRCASRGIMGRDHHWGAAMRLAFCPSAVVARWNP